MKQPIVIAVILAGVLTIGTIVWTAVANRSLRQDVRELKAEIVRKDAAIDSLHVVNDSIAAGIAERDTIIAQGTARLDSIKGRLEELNRKNIVTVYEDYSTVTALDFDGDIRFLSRFLAEADSVAQ